VLTLPGAQTVVCLATSILKPTVVVAVHLVRRDTCH
jgi:hypothetical protein